MKTDQSGMAAIHFGLCALIIYLVMILGTLNFLTNLADMRPFDLRPAGYSTGEAASLLQALGEAGRHYYLTRQIPLDMLYPALLALTLIATFRWRAFRFGPTILTWIGEPLAILAAAFDYLENLGIGLMLVSGPDAVSPLIQASSFASVLKSALTTAAISALVATLTAVVLKRMLRPRNASELSLNE